MMRTGSAMRHLPPALVLALSLVLPPICGTTHAASTPAARPQSPTATSRATLLLHGVDKDLRVLDRAQLTGDDKKQRDRAKSAAQNARKLLQDARSDNDAEALSMATIASKDVGAVIRRELKLDRLLNAAERYRAGNTSVAIEALSDSLASDLEAPVRYIEDNRDRLGVEGTALGDASDKTVAALALLETEIAFQGGYDAPARLALAARLLGATSAAQFGARFVERWYITVAGHLQGQFLLLDAMRHIEDAARRFPNDAEILVVAGAFYELIASPGVDLPSRAQTRFDYAGFARPQGDRVATYGGPPGTAGPITGALTVSPGKDDGYARIEAAKRTGMTRAEEFYRKALAVDAGNVEAHLRLGRVLHLTSRSDDGLAELRLAAASRDPRLHYLASMFEGAVQEAAAKPDATIACYEEALRTCPACLSAGLALSYAQRHSGEPAVAARTLDAATERDTKAAFADYWWDYPLGSAWRRDALMRDLRGGLR